MQSRLEELEDAPKIVQERQDDLNSLASIVKSIEQNPQLQEGCPKIHLTRVNNLIEELNRLLAEKLKYSANKPIQKFYRALTAPKTDEKIHSVFLALEGAKSNLHLHISNSFGESTLRLLENFSDNTMPNQDQPARRIDEERRKGKKTNTLPRQKDRRGYFEDDEGADLDKAMVPFSKRSEGSKATEPHDRNDSGDGRPVDEEVRSESDGDGETSDEAESARKLVYRKNVSKGEYAKVNNGPTFVNPPEGFKIPGLKASTVYEENRTYGDRHETTWGLRVEWPEGKREK